jgi:hypothetical protein
MVATVDLKEKSFEKKHKFKIFLMKIMAQVLQISKKFFTLPNYHDKLAKNIEGFWFFFFHFHV